MYSIYFNAFNCNGSQKDKDHKRACSFDHNAFKLLLIEHIYTWLYVGSTASTTKSQ